MRRMVVKKARNLTGAERRVCHAMSYKDQGDLSRWLWAAKYDPICNDDVVLYKEDGVIVGWGMRRTNGDVGFWVRRSHRQQGIGTKLVERTKKMGKIKAHPYHVPSAKLFLKTDTCPDKQSWQKRIALREAQKAK